MAPAYNRAVFLDGARVSGSYADLSTGTSDKVQVTDGKVKSCFFRRDSFLKFDGNRERILIGGDQTFRNGDLRIIGRERNKKTFGGLQIRHFKRQDVLGVDADNKLCRIIYLGAEVVGRYGERNRFKLKLWIGRQHQPDAECSAAGMPCIIVIDDERNN